MEPLRIDVDGADRVLRPGGSVSGSVQWALEEPPEVLELRLFWFTKGRGDRDAGIARTLRIEAPGAMGSQEFELDLPSGPYSFSGRLISLIWALELVAEPGDLSARAEIVVSPGDRELLIDEAAA